jgi:hypothetical protein
MATYNYQQVKRIERLLIQFCKLWCKYETYYKHYSLNDEYFLSPYVCYFLIKFQNILVLDVLPPQKLLAWQNLMLNFQNFENLSIRVLKKDDIYSTMV